MKLVGPLILAGIASVMGFVLGCSPVINEYLSWAILDLIPISGAIFALMISPLFVRVIKLLRVPLTTAVLVAVTLAPVAGVIAMDVGVYTAAVRDTPLSGNTEVSFPQYYAWRIYSEKETVTKTGTTSNISGRHSAALYFGDLVMAALGCLMVVGRFRETTMFCASCRRYGVAAEPESRALALELDVRMQQIAKFRELAAAGDSTRIVQRFHVLPLVGNGAAVRLRLHTYRCERCDQQEVHGTVEERKEDDEWKDVLGEEFRSVTGQLTIGRGSAGGFIAGFSAITVVGVMIIAGHVAFRAMAFDPTIAATPLTVEPDPPPAAFATEPALATQVVGPAAPSPAAVMPSAGELSPTEASPAFKAWAAAVRISGVRSGNVPRIILERGTYRPGDVVNPELGIFFESYDATRRVVRFIDKSGAVVDHVLH